jgi:hypothetical protein
MNRSVVSYKVETQTNPDVAIAYNTLNEVTREVQAEGIVVVSYMILLNIQMYGILLKLFTLIYCGNLNMIIFHNLFKIIL